MTATTNAAPAPLVPVPLRQELVGRLRNITKLKHWQMAVAEAVKNSMDAIADSKRSGAITVEVERVKDLASSGDGSKPVRTIVVRDNGIGFNDENYISFCTPDSLQKLNQGGKGLGRLMCLQAFHRIRVHSVFKNSNGWTERSLVLQCETPEHVNDARNGVSFAEEGDGVLLGITAPEFREACGGAFKKNLGTHLERAVEEFKKRIETVVSKEAPYYRPLLLGFFGSKEFTNLSTSSRDEEILSTLDTYKRRDAIKLRQESRRLAKLKSEGEDFWESARKLAGQIEAQKKVALAEYVTLRKIVLERLEQLLEAKGDGKIYRESAIHNLVFPQRTDTESNPGVDHQLWILDERLESHNYLASDKPMDGAQGDRPDLLIALDRPGAFASEPFSKSRGYERMVLVEFKRALTDLASVPTDDLPHQQMIRYARQIVDEKALHLGSLRPIKVAADARFYMYAVCELSDALLKRLVEGGFTPSPTGDGAFWVTNQGRYCIEYFSLPKLLEDAQARNLAFFRRLGLEA